MYNDKLNTHLNKDERIKTMQKFTLLLPKTSLILFKDKKCLYIQYVENANTNPDKRDIDTLKNIDLRNTKPQSF